MNDFCTVMSKAAVEYCASRGVSESTALKFGLMQSNCCRYLIIPVRNKEGNDLFFAGRKMFYGGHIGRYKYYGQLDRTVLFGMDIVDFSLDRVILVEGFFDVMTAYENGYTNVVANIGSATVGQPSWEPKATYLASLFQRVDVAFDGFPGGHPQQKAAVEFFRGLGTISDEIILPTGTDPAMLSKAQMLQYFGNPI